jgi:hypothetical protein
MSSESYIPIPEHERFEQMCALLALGELPEQEFKELQQHLTECLSCQQLYADFCRIGSDDLGFAAATRLQDAAAPNAQAISNEGSAYLDRLYDRIAGVEPAAQEVRPPLRSWKAARWLWAALPGRLMGACAIAAAMILALIAFYVRYQDAVARVARAEERSRSVQARLDSEERGKFQNSKGDVRAQAELLKEIAALLASREALQRQLADAAAKDRDWEARTADLTKQLSEASARTEQASRNLQQALAVSRNETENRNEAEQQLRSALKQLAVLQEQRTDAVLHSAEQERQMSELKSQLVSQSAALDRTQAAISGSGIDGKNLFGARNLHIVDVYDVDGKGNTRRTFGRVYFVEKKLLVFYAFDLEAKRRNQLAEGFQAWGYREVGSSKPESLGMFQLDDPALNRWTLSVNDPHVLEHIDALFVTLEPPGGSPTPKGRRLLYASLAGLPNHP